MKTGKSLQDLAAEIERQNTTRRDFVAGSRVISMIEAEPVEGRAGDVVIDGLVPDTDETFPLNGLAHRQLGDTIGIPAKYYDRMRAEAPGLLAHNVNTWFRKDPANRLFRTLDGRARAVLSDRYRPLENSDLAEAVLPVIIERKLEVVSCEITERRLYIKAVDASCVREIEGRGRVVDGRSVAYDHVSPSVVISNSEVGVGALSVEVGMFTHACKNMALFRERSMRKYHVGGRMQLGEDVAALLSDKTRRLDDAATWSKVKDVVASALNPEAFEQVIAEVRGMSAQRIISADIVKVVDFTAKHFDMLEGEKKSVLRHLIEGGELTRYGLFNAITRTAEDLADYDRATDFERMGGKVIELAANDWKAIAEAA